MPWGSRGSDGIEIGTVLRLGDKDTGITRRRFLKALGIGGIGIFGLKSAIEKAYGREVEGVPIVHTDDIYGNPDQVRIVPEERYRRIKVYTEIDLPTFFKQYPLVNEVSITSMSEAEEDLALQLHLDDDPSRSQKSNLPDQIQNVPVVSEVRPADWEPTDAGHSVNVCNARHNRVALRGGAAIGGWGTLGLVAFDFYSSFKVAITANHVVAGDNHMYQPCNRHPDSRRVGSINHRSPRWGGSGMDVASYDIRSGVNAWPRVTWRHDVPNVDGAWRFGGLTDATSPGTVRCEYTGARHCHITDRCNETSRNGRVKYEADMAHRRTRPGDSGGPWVDGGGKLLAFHHGWQNTVWGDYWSVGSVGRPALSAAGAKLYK